jgi:hypothetical protein
VHNLSILLWYNFQLGKKGTCCQKGRDDVQLSQEARHQHSFQCQETRPSKYSLDVELWEAYLLQVSRHMLMPQAILFFILPMAFTHALQTHCLITWSLEERNTVSQLETLNSDDGELPGQRAQINLQWGFALAYKHKLYKLNNNCNLCKWKIITSNLSHWLHWHPLASYSVPSKKHLASSATDYPTSLI